MPRGYPNSSAKKAAKKRAPVVEVEDEDDIIGGEEQIATQDTEDGTPVCPINGGLYGDKAEAVVNWWYENHPELAAKRYHRRVTHRS
jgi:hypothetical protein